MARKHAGWACRVAGALECLGVRQVECGLNLTVALTVDGRVWQMGETGAASDRNAIWERALAPVQVGFQCGQEARVQACMVGYQRWSLWVP